MGFGVLRAVGFRGVHSFSVVRWVGRWVWVLSLEVRSSGGLKTIYPKHPPTPACNQNSITA